MINKLLYFKIFTVFAILLFIIIPRTLHISADTPSGLSWSAGLYVDEGYKTLSPRNLVLFGSTKWHPADSYPGWMTASPLTQWPVYAAFSQLGVNISSARVVPIVYFSFLILLYVLFLKRRYPAKIFYLGLILLGTDATLFTYSRVALFEIPLSFFLYGLVLPLSIINDNKQSSMLPLIWLIIGGVAMSYSIKMTSLMYLAPVIVPISLLFLLSKSHLTKRNLGLLFAAILIALLALLVVTYNVWSARIDKSPLAYLYSVIENPLLITSPFLIIAGMLCAAHAIVYQPNSYLKSWYRVSLICMVVTAPFILSLFAYNPLRYFVPFLPAYILLVIEWLSTTQKDTTTKVIGYIKPAIGLVLLGLAMMYILTAFKFNEYIQMRFLIIVGAGLVLSLWYFRRFFFSRNIAMLTISSLVAFSVFHGIYFIGSFIINPTYHSNEMREQLSHIVKEDEVVAGGWAPFLTLGTPIKTLYSNLIFNPVRSLKIIKPNYYLYSETPNVMEAFEIIKADPEISIGKPIDLGKYNQTKVVLYRLSYNNK